jgi:hypothetical protein
LPFIDGAVPKPFEWEALVHGVHHQGLSGTRRS